MWKHDDLLTFGTLWPTFFLITWCLNESIRLDKRRLAASAQIVLCLCRMRPNVSTMVRDCNTLLNALVRGTKTEAEKGFLPNRRKDGCSKRLGTTRVLLFITITVRACNKPLTAFVRCSKTEAVPAQQTRIDARRDSVWCEPATSHSLHLLEAPRGMQRRPSYRNKRGNACKKRLLATAMV